MSRINGDKARSALQKRKGIVQRMKDRLRLAEIKATAVAEKKKPARKKSAEAAENA